MVATAIPSFATWSSVYSMPSFSQSGDLFGVVDRSGGVGNLGLAGAESLEPAAGAGGSDADIHPGAALREELSGGLGERLHRAGAVDLDLAGETAWSLDVAARGIVTAGATPRARCARSACDEQPFYVHVLAFIRFVHGPSGCGRGSAGAPGFRAATGWNLLRR